MSLKHRLRRVAREAQQGGILLRQRDGTVRVFPEMDVHAALFLARMDTAMDREQAPATKEILDAVRSATPESRADFEKRFGPITFSEAIISSDGAVRLHTLLEDGSVRQDFFEAGSEGARRTIQECREGRPHAL